MNPLQNKPEIKHLAIVFPGQGSQSVGMLSSVEDSSIVKETFAEASSVLGYDLWDLCQKGPEATLNQTEFTQPALLAASVAMWRQWQHSMDADETQPILPHIMAGHSLGEYSALVCAKAISFPTAVGLVRERGRCMQAAVAKIQGSMAAILGLSDEQVEALCAEVQQDMSGIIAAANYNSPGQVVIAGEKSLVERAIELAKEKGAKRAIILPVSVPSHCDLMKPAALAFANASVLSKKEFTPPCIPILHNVDVNMYSNPHQIASALIAQLYRPVRWVETIQKMKSMGIKIILECGPGNVLTSLNKRIVASSDLSSDVKCDSLQTFSKTDAFLIGETLCQQ